MRHDNNVFASLELHDDRFKSDDNITVRFTSTVSIVILVLITGCKVLGITLLDLLVSKTVAYAGVKFIESLPLKLVITHFFDEVTNSLMGTLESRCPDCELGSGRNARLAKEFWEGKSVLLATRRDIGIATNSTSEIELRFSVLSKSQC